MLQTIISPAIGVAAFVALLGFRAACTNRYVKKKISLSLFFFAAFVVIDLLSPVIKTQLAKADLAETVAAFGKLLFAFAAINALVVVVLNPWRLNRVPDRFPNIVQDAIVIAIFLVVGTNIVDEKWLALSAVGGFVIGFALQDTLGNLFAGLAVQVEKPFRAGNWIAVGGHEGMVAEITWRATKLRDKAGNLVVLPNNILSKEAITNFSEPSPALRLFVDVGASYDAPPNQVKAVLREALQNASLVSSTPSPCVVVLDFGASAIVYRLKFWVDDHSNGDLAADQVRTCVYYALKRNRIEIPYPIQVEYQARAPQDVTAEENSKTAFLLKSMDIFAPLSDEDRTSIVAESEQRLYAAEEAIVRQGASGESMFVICRGEVKVTLDATGQTVATIRTGGYFGEMSLLTGAARTATVSAVTDCTVLEITAETFRRLALMNPTVVEQISLIVATRRAELERSRAVAAAAAPTVESPRSFLARVQQFLGFNATA